MLLVNRILPLILPPEDMLNPCLDVLVSEIFAEMIFHNGICGKACEPWLIWDGVAKLLRSTRSGDGGPLDNGLKQVDGNGRSSSALASQDANQRNTMRGRFEAISQMFWLVIHCVVTFLLFLRVSVMALMQASALPQRTIRDAHRRKGVKSLSQKYNEDSKDGKDRKDSIEKRPIVGMSVWACASRILSFDQRMPWLSGMLSLLQWMLLHGPGRLCRTNSRLDR
jgi:hypothetical protein